LAACFFKTKKEKEAKAIKGDTETIDAEMKQKDELIALL
jgi:hypothetical protein